MLCLSLRSWRLGGSIFSPFGSSSLIPAAQLRNSRSGSNLANSRRFSATTVAALVLPAYFCATKTRRSVAVPVLPAGKCGSNIRR
jgi:hypothetical protein